MSTVTDSSSLKYKINYEYHHISSPQGQSLGCNSIDDLLPKTILINYFDATGVKKIKPLPDNINQPHPSGSSSTVIKSFGVII